MLSITAVIPCYNEEEQIYHAYQCIKQEMLRYNDIELLFINDGSTDGTLAKIKEIARLDTTVKYISFTKNFGLEAAFSAGFKYAQKDWTIQFDADLQSPPYEAHRLIEKVLEGYDAVFAIRQKRQDPLVRRFGSSAQQWIARMLLGISLPKGGSVFRIVRTSVARKIVELQLGTPYFLATLSLVGASYSCIPTDHHPRQSGKTKWNARKLIQHSFELFFGFSFVPLSFVYWLVIGGSLLCFIGLLIMLFDQHNVNWLGMIGLLATSLSLVSMAIISRYMQRIILEIKKTQLFYVRESNISILPEDALYEYEMPKNIKSEKEILYAKK